MSAAAATRSSAAIPQPRYTLFNAYASYKFNRNATAFINIENLYNVAYSPALSGEMGEKTGRGRSIAVGLTIQF